MVRQPISNGRIIWYIIGTLTTAILGMGGAWTISTQKTVQDNAREVQALKINYAIINEKLDLLLKAHQIAVK